MRIPKAVHLLAAFSMCTFFTLVSSSPAFAGVLPAEARIIKDDPTPVQVHRTEDGSAYWEIEVSADQDYVASWERATGVWKSPEEAIASITHASECASKATHAYAKSFKTHAMFEAAKHTNITDKSRTTFRWSTSDPKTTKAVEKCKSASEWSTDQIDIIPSQTDKRMIRIPFDVFGPGLHELFIAPIDYRLEGNCNRHTWSNGGYADSECPPVLGDVQRVAVIVPLAKVDSVVSGPVVESGSWFDSTVFSNLNPIESSTPIDDREKFTQQCLAALFVGLILSVLIALPTALIDSTIENNDGRIVRRLRGIILRRKAQSRATGTKSEETK